MNIWEQLNHYLEKNRFDDSDNCSKIFHGPGGGLPGLEFLIIDRMGRLIFVIAYRSFSDEEISLLVNILNQRFPQHFLRVQERGKGPSRDLYLSPSTPEQIVVREDVFSFFIHPGRGQNLGFFPDMINGRSRIGLYLSDCRIPAAVLNLFSYTCAFSVVSIQAGAARVDNWDMNRKSLQIGMRNHRLNNLAGGEKKARYFAHDIFKSFGKLRKNGPYDLIILDPPPRQGSSFIYSKDYPKLIRRMGEWLKTGGAALFCLNASDCSWKDFKIMIRDSLPGKFSSWEEIRPPENFTGRFPDRGSKCYFLTGWKGEKDYPDRFEKMGENMHFLFQV